MFKGEFVICEKNPYVRDKIIKLWGWHGTDNVRLEDFKETITPGVMGWNSADEELIYRDTEGKLYRAKFEVIDG